MKKLYILIFFLCSIHSVMASDRDTHTRVLSVHDITTQRDTLNASLSWGTIHLYARSRWLTPFFYLDDFPRYYGGGTGWTLILDDWNQVDPLEYVAFRNTAMQIHSILSYSGITLLQVTTKEYPYDSDPHYIDVRTVRIIEDIHPITERRINLPKQDVITNRMKDQIGKPYIWGGNSPIGLMRMLDFYKPTQSIDTLTKSKWTMAGFDCSGLLYWASNGYTPRNTSKLITFGTGVDIEWKTPEQIAKILRPLDVIVWRWHDRIVIDTGSIIESTANFGGTGNYTTPNGVRIVPIIDSLRDIINDKKRTPVNDWDLSKLGKTEKFVIRRWYP